MRWLRAVSVTCALSMVLSGCILRPRYQELAALSPGEGPITVQLVDAETGAPLPQVPVTIGEGVSRLKLKTDDQGLLTVPRDARLGSLNALVVIDRPKGVNATRLQAATAAPAPPPTEETAPQPESAPEESEAPAEQTPPVTIPEGGVGPGQPPGKNTPAHSDSPGQQPAPADAGTPAQ